MVADDEEYLHEAMRKLIDWHAMGCELIYCARNGRELIDKACELHPDIVIADIRMPVVNGLEAAKYLHENMPGMVMIFLTGYADFEYAAEAIHYEVSDYIVKTSMVEKLPEAVKKAIRRLERDREAVLSEQADADDITGRLQRFIEENYTQKLSLDDIARAVHANRSYISRLYKQKTGENLFQTINRLKIEQAKKYLADGMMIYETAEKVGFEDVAYFSRVFKKLEGCSPRDYEKTASQK